MANNDKRGRRQFLKLTGAAGVSVSALSGCLGDDSPGTDTTPATDRYGGTLQAGTKTDVVKVDPHTASAFQSFQVLENVYEKPIRLDPELRPYGELAENYETNDDGTTWTLKLRQGVQFHPPVSREMTADDVVYSLERILDEETGSPNRTDFTPIADWNAEDDYTVTLELDEPYAPLEIKLRNLYVIPEGAGDADDYDISTEPVGTGPFVWSEHEEDSYVLIERFDDYWDTDEDGNQLPYLDGVRFTPNAEASARITNLRTGEFDWISAAPQSQGDQLEDDDDLEFTSKTHGWMDYIAFNTNQSPMDDKNFRQAIAWAIDREAIVQGARFGWAEPTENLIPSTSAWREHIDVDEPREQDVETAQERLDASSYDDETVEILVSQPFVEQVSEAEIIQDMVGEIGIDVEIDRQDFSTMLSRIGESDFQMYILGWLSKVGPDDWFYNVFHSEGPDNNFGYSNTEVDDLGTNARHFSGSRADRGELYDQTLSIVHDELPIIPQLHNKVVMVYDPKVKDFVQRPDRWAIFRDVWMDEDDS